jgi:hypothetical protein
MNTRIVLHGTGLDALRRFLSIIGEAAVDTAAQDRELGKTREVGFQPAYVMPKCEWPFQEAKKGGVVSDHLMHPKQLAAEKRAVERQIAREQVQEDIRAIADRNGIQFIDVPPAKGDGEFFEGHGGGTLAYRIDRRNIAIVSNALLHPNDRFDKNTGRLLAAQRFEDGCTVQIRVPTRDLKNVKFFLKYHFFPG